MQNSFDNLKKLKKLLNDVPDNIGMKKADFGQKVFGVSRAAYGRYAGDIEKESSRNEPKPHLRQKIFTTLNFINEHYKEYGKNHVKRVIDDIYSDNNLEDDRYHLIVEAFHHSPQKMKNLPDVITLEYLKDVLWRYCVSRKLSYLEAQKNKLLEEIICWVIEALDKTSVEYIERNKNHFLETFPEEKYQGTKKEEHWKERLEQIPHETEKDFNKLDNKNDRWRDSTLVDAMSTLYDIAIKYRKNKDSAMYKNHELYIEKTKTLLDFKPPQDEETDK